MQSRDTLNGVMINSPIHFVVTPRQVAGICIMCDYFSYLENRGVTEILTPYSNLQFILTRLIVFACL